VTRLAVFDVRFREDLQYWVRIDRNTALRVLQLVEEVMRDPVSGIGKPERLRHLGAGVWLRRITQEHRLVYQVSEERVYFLQCRFHYGV
jgi:toxin YoeB